MTTLGSRMNTRLCNFIMWFIFNLRRKKILEIIIANIYILYIYTKQNIKQDDCLFFSPIELQLCSFKQAQTPIFTSLVLCLQVTDTHWAVSITSQVPSLVFLVSSPQFKQNLNTCFIYIWLQFHMTTYMAGLS